MTVTYREAALRHAQHYIGVKERPSGSNSGPLIDEWNREAGAPAGSFWCCSFVHGMFKLAGFLLPGGASVEQLRLAGRAGGWLVARPRRGDLACFDFREGDKYGPFGDHVGLVERCLALRWSGGTFTGWIRTVEGNTAAQNDITGSQSDGGGVFRRWRWMRGISAEFLRVPGKQPAV